MILCFLGATFIWSSLNSTIISTHPWVFFQGLFYVGGLTWTFDVVYLHDASKMAFQSKNNDFFLMKCLVFVFNVMVQTFKILLIAW